MKPQSVCPLALLSLFCVLITVQESVSPFAPGRCLCPQMQNRVRGQLKDLKVFPQSPGCDKETVIVTLKRSGESVCVNPEAPMGKQLIHCWKRSLKLGRNVKLCLRRKRRRAKSGQHQSRQKVRGHK
ncbi:C-X-C motif chemokine 10-like [Thalassophryne amazonica]|uniref:C-X-C motif chemokine 10-like n=1 Tax=Thalassophryne amazonica TaxID=390379 RepID=UPI00147110F2|nr:C-X-C motif chemokine 10-like [Thalassophryne amazonica]